MTVLVLEARRPNETDADYEARRDAHQQRLEEAAEALRKLREVHTGKAPKRETNRTI